MSTYLLNFIVYTTAMIGIIFLAVFVYKKCSYNCVSKSKFLNVEDCINLSPRKSLYVVRAGNERFLIASDPEKTSLISKLDENTTFLQDSKGVEDLPNITVLPQRTDSKKVFKNIINNI